MMKPICVMAGSYEQYIRWLQEHGLQRRDAIYAADLQSIRGAEFSRIEKIGTWYTNPSRHDIEQEAMTRIR